MCSYVCIAMEALDQLLMACHCQSINLFVESFLTMVRKLLEADKPNLQILGTNSVGVTHRHTHACTHTCFKYRTVTSGPDFLPSALTHTNTEV